MESILGRSQFLGETGNLFTDERTANARSKVIDWINELNTVEPKEKCEILSKIQETIIGCCPELLEEFLESILVLGHDQNADVRRAAVGFFEQICKVKIELMPQIVRVVVMMIRDRSPQVVKRVIQACGSIYRNGLQWICTNMDATDSVTDAWDALGVIKAQILDLIDDDNDGIRTNVIKFLEGVVVLQSYPDEDSHKKDNDFSLEDVPENLKITNRTKLKEEAVYIFDILLKFHAANHISSVNLIACTGSLCTIAKLRPSLMGPVIEAFKNLNQNMPATLSDSQINSVRKNLKIQLMALLKNRGSYEYHAAIRHMLLDLGSTMGEIQRTIPKMDKQEQLRRQKRILENATSNLNKKMRFTEERVQMEVDEEELEKQRRKCMTVNEKFVTERLRDTNIGVNMVVEFLPANLPDSVPDDFLEDYEPIRDMSVQQLIATISKLLSEQMTAQKIGPGIAAFTKDPPMRKAQSKAQSAVAMDVDLDIEIREQTAAPSIDDATKKLRENMERVKGEQELIERMKQRAKTLKLQEVTKPFSRITKEKFLLEAVKRILNAERQCMVRGVSAKRRKILTVMAATFPDKVRYFIFDFIMMDIKNRIDLAFSWLYEEYCLLQGFTRHSYVKSENRPDYAYNELLSQLVSGIKDKCELKDKIVLFRRVFLEAPLLSDEALGYLVKMCFQEEYTSHGLELLKDLTMLRPPRKSKFLNLLLTFSVHERSEMRTPALGHIVTLYNECQSVSKRIEDFALNWVTHLEKETPPNSIFSENYGRPTPEPVWKEETTKICLVVFLALLPYKSDVFIKKLGHTYTSTAPDLKRTILRSIDSAIKKLGPDDPAVLKFIEDCPRGTETLVIRIIYILTERVPTPGSELMRRVRDLYEYKVKDVRLLIPVLAGLTRQEILNSLPKLLKLNPVVVREVFNRLLGIGAEFALQTIAVTPTDILVALHTIDSNECDLKFIVKATSICLSEREVYTQDVLIGVLQQLVEVMPIPTLLMRTIIQSLTLYPHLTNFVLNLLQRLILKKVWHYKLIWEGFLKCCQRLKPQSLAVLLQLPPQQLKDALDQCPDLRMPLLEYARSIEDEPMSGVTPQLLDLIEGKEVDVFITDETGGYISIENIKKEIEDPDEISTIGTVMSMPMMVPPVAGGVQIPGIVDPSQPLPPGED